ncbi:MAG TPA: cytochrome c3 family protein [Geobacteraceae bacterium]
MSEISKTCRVWRRCAALAGLLTMLWVGLGEAAVSLVYPSPKGSVNRSSHLIVKLGSQEITGVKITVNGLASDLLQVGTPEYRKFFQDFLILQPVWDKGSNDVIIEVFIGDKKVETLNADIFYSPKEAPLDVPADYRPSILHVAETEKLCAPCHFMRPTAAQVNNSLEKDNPCYGCHKRMANQKYVHGPTGTFSCAYCHSTQGQPKYATPRRDASLCNECHADKGAELKKRKYLHGPVAAGMCEICHDPHGSENPAQLRQPINQLCLSCHEQVGKEPHITQVTAGQSHPLSDKPDPSDRGRGRPMSCVSCHNPHGGDVRYYFQNNAEDRMQLCQMCHRK